MNIFEETCQDRCRTVFKRPYQRAEVRITALDAFVTELSHPMKLMEHRFHQLELDSRPFQVLSYATNTEIKETEDALKAFDSSYDLNATTKSQLQKIPVINTFLSSYDHYHITEYTLEICLCGKLGCALCAIWKYFTSKPSTCRKKLVFLVLCYHMPELPKMWEHLLVVCMWVVSWWYCNMTSCLRLYTPLSILT